MSSPTALLEDLVYRQVRVRLDFVTLLRVCTWRRYFRRHPHVDTRKQTPIIMIRQFLHLYKSIDLQRDKE